MASGLPRRSRRAAASGRAAGRSSEIGRRRTSSAPPRGAATMGAGEAAGAGETMGAGEATGASDAAGASETAGAGSRPRESGRDRRFEIHNRRGHELLLLARRFGCGDRLFVGRLLGGRYDAGRRPRRRQPVIEVAEIDFRVVLAFGEPSRSSPRGRRPRHHALPARAWIGGWASECGRIRRANAFMRPRDCERTSPHAPAAAVDPSRLAARRAALRPSRSMAEGACRLGFRRDRVASCRGDAPQGRLRRSQQKF